MARSLLRIICVLPLLAGCAADGIIWTEHRDGAGGPVRVLEMPGQECPEVISGGRPAGGCATNIQTYVIFYPAGDLNARDHELEHVAGMRHGAWRIGPGGAPCAVVTAAGRNTRWKAGDLLCRAPDGRYFAGSDRDAVIQTSSR